ncbi:MAG: hypothetical protein ACE5GX_13775 [Thermoanaerobaculia bacterium]
MSGEVSKVRERIHDFEALESRSVVEVLGEQNGAVSGFRRLDDERVPE